MKQLPVCYDADAGVGRFVASFAFLNRTDRSVVLHPFLIYEGSDCRANLEMTLGEFTETIDELEDRPVLINNVDVQLKQFGHNVQYLDLASFVWLVIMSAMKFVFHFLLLQYFWNTSNLVLQANKAWDEITWGDIQTYIHT